MPQQRVKKSSEDEITITNCDDCYFVFYGYGYPNPTETAYCNYYSARIPDDGLRKPTFCEVYKIIIAKEG